MGIVHFISTVAPSLIFAKIHRVRLRTIEDDTTLRIDSHEVVNEIRLTNSHDPHTLLHVSQETKLTGMIHLKGLSELYFRM